MAPKRLTHFDRGGNAIMVDVTEKAVTERVAVATGSVAMKPATLKAILANGVKKGDVLAVARLAGIMAAKRTHELVPLCHPLALSAIAIDLTPNKKRHTVDITATVKISGKTGVEMEALTAVSVAALTVYDMCKAIDRGMTIGDIQLRHKSGGKSGTYQAPS
jgi:cyclic pyranopterin phosphate synthase